MKRVVHAFNYMMSFSKLYVSLLILSFSFQLTLLITSRPSQDDYGYLASLIDISPIEATKNFWDLWGGNISSIFISSLFSKLAVLFNLSCAFICLGLLTTMLTGLATNAAITIFMPGLAEKHRLYVTFFMSCFGIASLAYPAHLASVAFTTATIAHLWPILIFLIVLKRAYEEKSSHLEHLISGLLLANANIAEGVALLFFSIVVLGIQIWNPTTLENYFLPKMRAFLVLIFGMILGLILIVISPGFISRIGVVNQNSPVKRSLAHSLLASFVDFSAAVIAAPIFIFMMLILLYLVFQRKVSLKIILGSTPLESLLALSLFAALTGGATFAYAAWHQSLGLIYCVQLLGILLFLKIGNQVNSLNFSKLEIPLIVTLLLFFSWDISGSYQRQQSWDQAFHVNKCLIRLHSGHALVGADLLNPVTRLGFEDIESWDWIKKDYIKWVKKLPEEKSCENAFQILTK